MRAKQKARTRAALVDAASALLARGAAPSLETIADEAQVSRATAYRYFAGLEALLGEATAEMLVPEANALFGASALHDPFERLALLDDKLDAACRAQPALRLGYARAPARQARRLQLIEQALAPLAARLGRVRITRLSQALAMVIGTEGFLALNDAVGLNSDDAREVRRWAIDALVAAALNEAYSAR